MKRIVSNATPLIYLAKAGKLDLLRFVFREVVIPEEVKVEVVDTGKSLGEKDAYIVEKTINEGWIKVLSGEILEVPIKLDPGGTAVLSLAKKLGIKEVLVDEVSARVAARLLDLRPRGTIYVLLRSLKERKIDLDEFLEILNQMVGHGFRLKEEVYVEAIKEARRIDGEDE
ncbi:MAG: DUF3368 domain-containing protein [Archaeoglobaceae archaeon]